MVVTVVPGEPPQTGQRLFSQSYLSRLDLKPDIIDALSGILFEHHLVLDEDRHWLQLCLDEVVVNAMLHGNEGDPSLSISIAIDVENEYWAMTVSDQGEGFDPDCIPDCEDPDSLLLEHGRGIQIMSAWLSELTYYRNGSCAYMRRLIPGKTRGSTATRICHGL